MIRHVGLKELSYLNASPAPTKRKKLSHQSYKERASFKLSNIWVCFPRKVTTYPSDTWMGEQE